MVVVDAGVENGDGGATSTSGKVPGLWEVDSLVVPLLVGVAGVVGSAGNGEAVV